MIVLAGMKNKTSNSNSIGRDKAICNFGLHENLFHLINVKDRAHVFY